MLYYFFARKLPVSSYPFGKFGKWLRYHLCRRLFRSCGKNVNVERGADFGNGRSIAIGDSSGLGVDCWIRGDVIIGRNVMMGPFVVMYARYHEHARTDIPIQAQGMGQSDPIEVEDGVWICARAIILKGVRIGAHSIVAAGAVVTRDVPPYAVVAGCPARVVRYRKAPDEAARAGAPEPNESP